jgi:hypothetical protein
LPPGTTPQVPNTIIASSVWNAALDDIAASLNVAWPVAIGIGAAGATGSWDSINIAGADIASSGTINLTTATGPNLTITGTTTVTTVTLASGNVRFARANAAFQLTASANLIINGSASTNYTTTAGDLLIFIGGAGSVTRVWAISGSVAAASNAEVIAGTVANKYVSPATAYFPTGHLYGCTLSNNVTDATNDIDIAVGTARSSDDTANILLASALTKRLDATWAVGTNQGMLASGAAIANTTYHIFLIKRPDTGVVDIAADTSVTGANIAANTNVAYTQIRRIGSILRESAAIVSFTQNGDRFVYNTITTDSSAVTGTTAQTQTLRVPDGIQVAVFGAMTTSGNASIYPSALTQTDQASSSSAAPGGIFIGTSVQMFGPIMTNTSKQIRTRSNANVTLGINSWGYYDTRGR